MFIEQGILLIFYQENHTLQEDRGKEGCFNCNKVLHLHSFSCKNFYAYFRRLYYSIVLHSVCRSSFNALHIVLFCLLSDFVHLLLLILGFCNMF